MSKRPRLGRYLGYFLLWSALLGFLHYQWFWAYAEWLFMIAEPVLGWLTGNRPELSLAPSRSIPGAQGFLLRPDSLPQPLHYGNNLYSVTLNFMFGPALVFATVGTNPGGWLRALAAALIMLLLHVLHVVTIALYFPLTQMPVPNPVVGADFPPGLAAPVRWTYTFLDKMAYTLFPFIAWFAVCYGRVIALVRGLGAAAPAHAAGPGPK